MNIMTKITIKTILLLFLSIPFIGLAQTEITLEDIHTTRKFSPKRVSGFNSMNDGLSYCKFVENEDGDRDLVRFSFENNENLGTIFSSQDIKGEDGEPIPFQSFEFSEDEKLILLYSASERIYRHSFRAIYYVFDLETKQTIKIAEDKVRYATISPNNQFVAYVLDNNLYYVDIKSGQRVQITRDGKKNEIINGAVDWVYEEEFSMSKGFEWSPNSDRIAYYRFDESKVPEFTMPMYGSLYPRQETWKYPKAGEVNSVVDVYVFDRNKMIAQKCDVGSEKDQYIPRIQWTKDNNILAAQRLNRHQNQWELLFVFAQNGDAAVVLKDSSKYYVEIKEELTFLDNGTELIYTSEKDGFNHVYIYNFVKNKERQVTNGPWDVTRYYGINKETEMMFYSSSEVSATERHLYSIKLNGKSKKKLTVGAGFHTISFSKGMQYYMENYSSMNRAPEYSLHRSSGEQLQILEDNSEFMSSLEAYDLPEATFEQLTTEDNVTLNYWMIKPANFDKNKKYPLLMYVYGGPGINTVNNTWGGHYMWYQMLAQKGYIIVSVDATGTGFRGEEFKKKTYLQLGNYESRDQIESAKYFGNLDYIDADRIGIWGWSYGGYMSSLCLAKGNDVFKMAMAVAPVTNWRYYDNIYTERFMRTPQENPQGYDTNSPINHVDKIKGNFLIVHGTADDNVHFQNAVEMVDAMISKNIDFDSEFYPNKNHSIYGGYTRWHLFRRLTSYIEDNL